MAKEQELPYHLHWLLLLLGYDTAHSELSAYVTSNSFLGFIKVKWIVIWNNETMYFACYKSCINLKPWLMLLFVVSEHNEEPDLLYKLMGAYIVLGFVGFLLILLFLDKIGARVDPEKSAYEVSVLYQD